MGREAKLVFLREWVWRRDVPGLTSGQRQSQMGKEEL